MICIAVSFLVMIIAVAISSGFRHELRDSLSDMSGDILLSAPDLNVMSEDHPLDAGSQVIGFVSGLESVSEVIPVVWRAGIVKHGEEMHGVVLKGVPSFPSMSDSVALGVSIPRRLAQVSGLKVGELVHVIADCHIYDRHIPAVKAMLEKEGYPAPKVTLDKSITDFYDFTKDSFKVENYQFHPFDFEIPMAI